MSHPIRNHLLGSEALYEAFTSTPSREDALWMRCLVCMISCTYLPITYRRAINEEARATHSRPTVRDERLFCGWNNE